MIRKYSMTSPSQRYNLPSKRSTVKIDENIKGNVSQINLDGRFDAHTCGAIEQFLRQKIANGNYNIVLNLEKVPFIASAGLRVLLIFAKELRQKYHGDIRLSSLQPNVQKVFEIAGLNTVISIFDTVEDAIMSFIK